MSIDSDKSILRLFFPALSPPHEITQLYYTELGTVQTRKTSSQAKDLLELKQKQIPFQLELIRLDMEGERRPEMEAMSGVKTLPQIFVNNKYIGVSDGNGISHDDGGTIRCCLVMDMIPSD